MTTLKMNTQLKIFSLLIIFSFIAACSPQVSTVEPVPSITHTSSIKEAKPTSSDIPEPTGTQEPIITSEPLRLFLPEPLPFGIINSDIPFVYKRSYYSNTLWFGHTSQAPQGEILHTTDWVYALAAPFPTIIDDLSSEEFQDLWHGGWEWGEFSSLNVQFNQLSEDEFEQLRAELLSKLPFRVLYVPKTIAGLMKNSWGYPDETLVKIARLAGSTPNCLANTGRKG